MRQLEEYARATFTPLGLFFLSQPPVESIPIPDFRTVRDNEVGDASPNLLDTIHICQERQDWYRDFATSNRLARLGLLGSVRPGSDVLEVASAIQELIPFTVSFRSRQSSWADALREFIGMVEGTGILVMVSGIVGSNTHRKLDPKEFRGFALFDPERLAPLVFINGADTKAAQIFTLAHELAHLWSGESGVDSPDLSAAEQLASERWANQVAGEFLLPTSSLSDALSGPTLVDDLERLARIYKVSTLVVLRRLADAELISRDTFFQTWPQESERIRRLMAEQDEATESSGGNYYNTQPYRVSRRFAQALITDTLEGNTLHRDALRMLGMKKVSTMEQFGERLGVA